MLQRVRKFFLIAGSLAAVVAMASCSEDKGEILSPEQAVESVHRQIRKDYPGPSPEWTSVELLHSPLNRCNDDNFEEFADQAHVAGYDEAIEGQLRYNERQRKRLEGRSYYLLYFDMMQSGKISFGHDLCVYADAYTGEILNLPVGADLPWYQFGCREPLSGLFPGWF